METSVLSCLEERNDAIYRLGLWAASFATLVGENVMRELAVFAREAGTGSMITVRCTRDGFTAQVTGAIVGGRSSLLSPEAISVMAAELE